MKKQDFDSRNKTENELLETYFKTFDIPEEKRSNERIQREILKYFKQHSRTSSLGLFARCLDSIIMCLWKFIVGVCKCVVIALIAPFLVFWVMSKDIKTHIKMRVFIVKYRGLIWKLNELGETE